jgi:hypothetical protein
MAIHNKNHSVVNVQLLIPKDSDLGKWLVEGAQADRRTVKMFAWIALERCMMADREVAE